MDTINSETERTGEEYLAPTTGDAGASNRMATPRTAAVPSAFALGALLGGLVALIQGAVTLATFSVRLGREGFFKSWVIATTFAMRSLLGLLLVELIMAGIGGLTGAAGVLVWKRITAPVRTPLMADQEGVAP
jgi:hypothetical protein